MRVKMTKQEALQLLEGAVRQKEQLHPEDELLYLVDNQIVILENLIRAFEKYP